MFGVPAAVLSVIASLAVTSPAAADEPIVVTRESQSLPSGCTPREVASLLVRFTDAVNRGDTDSLARMLPTADAPRGIATPGTEFRWYSVTDPGFRHAVVYTRADALAYFAERHEQNERLELIAVDVAPSWVVGGAGITYALRRDADDLPPTLSRFAFGKGGIDCKGQRIYVWSMGHTAGDVPIPCPRPSGWTPGEPIIACSRTGPNARAFSPDYRTRGGSNTLPRPCAPLAAKRRLGAALSAFNGGEGARFARQLTPRGSFHPYTLERPLVGRTKIAGFVNRRYKEGDGWTATALDAPRKIVVQRFGTAPLQVAEYGLSLRLASPRKPPVSAARTSIVIDCRSGLIHRWTGPRISAP